MLEDLVLIFHDVSRNPLWNLKSAVLALPKYLSHIGVIIARSQDSDLLQP